MMQRHIAYLVTTMAGILMLISNSALATDWVLNSKESRLNFISVKKTHIAEIHQFKELKGELDGQGNFSFEIDLNSVDTNIDIRNERMREYLFQSGLKQFSQATVSANIDTAVVDGLTVGANTVLAVDASLSLHGQTKPLSLELSVSRLADDELLVVSTKPVIIKAEDFALVSGIDKLKELAKLPSISHAVPVTFELLFTGYNE